MINRNHHSLPFRFGQPKQVERHCNAQHRRRIGLTSNVRSFQLAIQMHMVTAVLLLTTPHAPHHTIVHEWNKVGKSIYYQNGGKTGTVRNQPPRPICKYRGRIVPTVENMCMQSHTNVEKTKRFTWQLKYQLQFEKGISLTELMVSANYHSDLCR